MAAAARRPAGGHARGGRSRGAHPHRPRGARRGGALGQRDDAADRRAAPAARPRCWRSGPPSATCCSGSSGSAAQTVEELRSLVGILREPGADESPTAPSRRWPAPTTWSTTCGRPASTCDLEVGGEPGELPRALDISAYRIVQEALTNVLRHAPGGRATGARRLRQRRGRHPGHRRRRPPGRGRLGAAATVTERPPDRRPRPRRDAGAGADVRRHPRRGPGATAPGSRCTRTSRTNRSWA